MFRNDRLEKEIEQALTNKGVYRILLTSTNHLDEDSHKLLNSLNFRYKRTIKCWCSQTLYTLHLTQWSDQFQKDIAQIKKYQSRKGDLGIMIMTDSEFEDVKNDVNFRQSLEQKKESLRNRLIDYFKKYLKT